MFVSGNSARKFESNAFKITFLLNSELWVLFTFRVRITFYTVGEKSNEYKTLFGEKSENRDKLIQYGTPGQPTKYRDSWNVYLCGIIKESRSCGVFSFTILTSSVSLTMTPLIRTLSALEACVFIM